MYRIVSVFVLNDCAHENDDLVLDHQNQQTSTDFLNETTKIKNNRINKSYDCSSLIELNEEFVIAEGNTDLVVKRQNVVVVINNVEGTELSVSKTSGSASSQLTVIVTVVHVTRSKSLRNIDSTSELNHRATKKVLGDNTNRSGHVATDVETSDSLGVIDKALNSHKSPRSTTASIVLELVASALSRGSVDNVINAGTSKSTGTSKLDHTKNEGAMGSGATVGDSETSRGENGKDNVLVIKDGTTSLEDKGGAPTDLVGLTLVVQKNALNAIVVHSIDKTDEHMTVIKVIHIKVAEGQRERKMDPLVDGELGLSINRNETSTQSLLLPTGSIVLGTSTSNDVVGGGETSNTNDIIAVRNKLSSVHGGNGGVAAVGNRTSSGVELVIFGIIHHTEVRLIEGIELGLSGLSREGELVAHSDINGNTSLVGPGPLDVESTQAVLTDDDEGLVGHAEEVNDIESSVDLFLSFLKRQ